MQFKFTVSPASEEIRGCTRCKRNLPISAFGRHAYCRECNRQQASTQGRRLPRPKDQRRNNNLRHVYGITLEDFYDMRDAQDGKCAICRRDPGETTTGKGLHVDHCHATGKVRGLLCFNCNGALGHMKDDIERLASAIRYLENSQEKNLP